MSWLARLKAGKTPEKDPSKTTETLFVVSVAHTLAPLQKNEGATVAANDPALTLTPIAATVDIGTVSPLGVSTMLLTASLALDASIVVDSLPGHDPNTDYFQYSTALNGAEIDLFAARLHRFTDKGLNLTDGEVLADRLVKRDQEADDRRLCLECRHLSGYGRTSWRCGNWQAAGIAIRSRENQLPADLVLQLQRCYGFASATPIAKANATTNSTDPTPF